MSLAPGTRLAAYEITGPLGAGGMGEVYRAKDTRLDREVAIKVLAEHLVDNPAALAQFEREARAVAALSHPNILALHDFGRDARVAFAVTELLDGRTLTAHIAAEAFTWRRAVEIVVAIADGLASAHARGIVHRDLTPANVFITRDGLVKILDFGLASPAGSCTRGLVGDAAADTATTEPAGTFGTPGYLSPEQAAGDAVDHRTDIFALGCVLYEMLTGRAAFRRETPQQSLVAVLREQPPEIELGDGRAPGRVAAIVRRCLEKQPERRFQSTRDLAFALREALNDPGETSAAETNTRGRRRARASLLRVIALLGALAIGAWVLMTFLPPQVTSEGRRSIRPLAGLPRGDLARNRSETAREVTPLRVVPAAYDAYVRGRHAWDKRSESDLHQAIRFFQASIDADPTYAPAYAGLADCYGQLGYGSYISPADAFPRARAAAQKAIELDPQLAEAHASLGYALMYYDWDFRTAEAEYRRAIELKPNAAVAHQWYAYLLTAMERPVAEATREIATARSLDPLSVPINLDEAYVLYYYGRTADALHSVRLALDMNPNFAPAYFWLGRIYTSQGRYAEAENALQHIGPLRTWTPAMATIGYLYGKSGRRREAAGVLKEFGDLTRRGAYASSYAIAVIYAGLGDRERALSALDAALRERSHWLVWLKRDPRWNDIRSDPRFRDLVRKVGLPN